MALIVQKVAGDLALELGNEMFIRPMAMGNNWQKLRVGIRFNHTATSSFVTAGLLVGVCRGFEDYASSNVDLVGGHLGSGVFTTTFTYISSLTVPYVTVDTTSTYGLTKVGATVNTAGAATNVVYMSAVSSCRNVQFVDITKGTAGTYTVKMWITNSLVNAQVDRPKSAYTAWMVDETTAGGVLIAGSVAATTYAGSGILDSVFVRWNKSNPPIVITDLSVVRYT
jgi:hypothetical protein